MLRVQILIIKILFDLKEANNWSSLSELKKFQERWEWIFRV